MKIAPITVELLDHMGDDLSVVNAARVSFDKESSLVRKPYVDPNECLFDHELSEECFELSEKDARLITYLAKHNHWTPFAHCFLSFRVKVPMFVAMQLDKHTVGLATNSVSRRYVSSEPEFYFPDTWRKAAANVKQGSSDEEHYNSDKYKQEASFDLNEVLTLYKDMILNGVCAEQARMVLPMNTMTERIWSGSLAAFARVCKLRLDPHSQKETRAVAKWVADAVRPLFPVSFPALLGELK